VQKNEIKLIDRKVAKEKLTGGQSNLLFSNQAHALDGATDSWRNFSLIAWYACVPSAQPSRNFFINQHGEIFSCILLTGNQMIFLVQFGINNTCKFFSKTTNCTRPTGSCNFVGLWKNLLVLIYSKLHSKSLDYPYKFRDRYRWNDDKPGISRVSPTSSALTKS